MSLNYNQKGQGVLEAVFAIGILLIAVTAILGLTMANILGQSESEFQIVANNLAREGIEVVRHIRDSNWLAGEDWDQGLIGDGEGVPDFNQVGNIWTFNFSFNEITTVYEFGGVYNHNALGEPTIYRRLVTLQNICLLNGTETIEPSGSSCVSGQKVGIKIAAQVDWIERGRDRSIILEDLIYAWK